MVPVTTAHPSSTDAALSGRRILITGAASGIGKATAELFVASGAQVALVDYDLAAVSGAATVLGMPSFGCDVGDAEQVARTIDAADAALGGIDGIVNAAGIFVPGTVEALKLEDWSRVMNTNLLGPLLVGRQALPALRRAGEATIVNIASIGGLQPAHGVSAYATSKAGLIMLGKCMAFELSPGIRVNTVCPGSIETPMLEGGLTAETRARLEKTNMLQRLGRPDEIAGSILFLTSHASSYVNGATLVVDGGYSWR